jgi:hypothetical protein
MKTDHCPEPDQSRPTENSPGSEQIAGPSGSSVTDSVGQTLVTLTGDSASAAPAVSPGSAAETRERAARSTGVARRGALLDLQPGDTLGKYDILGLLGRGGMGVVFKAHDTALDRTVALKVLGPHLATNAAARKRFIREGRSAAAVKDQNVVTIYAVEEHEGSPYLVLEFVEGKPLDDLLERSAPLPVEEVVRIGAQVAQGLAAAHQKGLIHRDVKPANVLLESETGRVALTDFGLARAADDASVSRQGEICGTPHYMAPEQVRGLTIDHRADLFSLGSLLYCLCTGELPFDADSTAAVLRRVSEDRPRPVAEVNPAVPAWLAGLIESLHAKEPAGRPQSAAEVKAALLAGKGPASTTLVMRPPAPPVAVATPPSGVSGRAVLACVLGLVFVASLPAFYFLTRPDEKPPREERPAERRAAQAKPRQEGPVAPKEVAKKPEAPAPKPPAKPRVAAPPAQPPRPVKAQPTPPPAPARGVVVIRTADPASAEMFRNEGLAARSAATSQVVRLDLTRNYLPVGDYTLEPCPAPGFRVSPRQFTVSLDRSVYLVINFPPPPRGPSEFGAGPSPGGPAPPMPPPPGGPPPRPSRR